MKKEKQKRGKKQIVLIVAGIVIGVLAVIYLAFAFYFHSHFLFHTKINGMDSSCATVSDVEDKIRNWNRIRRRWERRRWAGSSFLQRS